MKTLLIFPPTGYMMSPYLSLPTLVAYMKKNGFSHTFQRDLNIEFLEEILKKERLEPVYKKVQKRFERLNSKDSLNFEDQSDYLKLSLSLISAPYLIKNIEKSKKLARIDKDSQVDFPTYTGAMDVIKKAKDFYFINHQNYVQETSYSKDEFLSLVKNHSNPYSDLFKEKFLQSILDVKPDILGIAICFFEQLIPAFTLASLIRENNKSLHITAGGSMITILKDKLLDFPEFFEIFDTFISHEGEVPLLNLVKTLEAEKAISDVSGILYKKGNKVINTGTPSPVSIKEIPPPDFSGFPLHLYFSPELYIPLTVTRGCSWNKCSFCAFSEAFDRKYRVKTGKEIAKDLKSLISKYDTNYFEFSDNALPVKALISGLEILKDEDIDVFWTGQAIPTSIFSEENSEKLHDLGCKLMMFGMETGCDRILSLMNKNFKVKDLKEAIWNCHNAGLSVLVFVIIGFPGETEDEAEITLNFIKENREAIDFVCIHPFALSSGSSLSSEPEKYGVVKLEEEDLSTAFNYELLEGISSKEAWEKVSGSGFNNDVFYPYFCLHREMPASSIKGNSLLTKEEFFKCISRKVSLNENVSFLKLNYNWARWKDLTRILKSSLSVYRKDKIEVEAKYPDQATVIHSSKVDDFYVLEKKIGDRFREFQGKSLLLKDFLERLFVKLIIKEETLSNLKNISEEKLAFLTGLKDRFFSKEELSTILHEHQFNHREIQLVVTRAEYFYKEEEILLIKNLLAKNFFDISR